jgi:hypothetical protein
MSLRAVIAMAEGDKGGGKIVPLESRRSGVSAPSEVKGKAVPLPLKPRTSSRLEWEHGYFPISLKQYYRTILIEHKKGTGIGNQSLRDQILSSEDRALVAQYVRDNGREPKKRLRDTRLTLDDLKKWLSPNAIHQLGDPKFTFVNRYVQGLIAAGELEDIETQYSKERKNFHQQSLRDIFALGYESEEFISQLDGYAAHALLSAGRFGDRAHLPTALLLIDGFSVGVSPVTMLFSEFDLERKYQASSLPEGWLEGLCAQRFPFILRGYLILTAKHPSGDPPQNPYVEGKLILATEDVQVDFESDLRNARFLCTALVQITKNDAKEVMNYGITIDATDFPEETAPIFRKTTTHGRGDKGADSLVRLTFDFLDGGEPVNTLVKKFSGVYPA